MAELMDVQGDDFYSANQLIQIWKESQSEDPAVLAETGRRLFPDKNVTAVFQLETGLHGRCFPSAEDPELYVVPKYTLKCGKTRWIGIMEDGRVIPY